MFVERSQGQQSPLRKQLKMIADLAHYQPVPSIPSPSMGFNYTLSRQRYSDYESPRIMPKPNRSPVRSQDLKLTTILQNSNHLFPRIVRPSKQSPNFKKVQRLPTYFSKERQETEATRERSLTYDTPMTNEEERFISLEHRSEEPFQTYEKQSTITYRNNPSSPHQGKPQHRHIVEECQSQESESCSEDEFDKDAVPGPGSYSYSYSDFDKKSFSKKSTKASFISQSSRFPQLKQPLQASVQIPPNPLEVEKEKRREERMKLKKSKKKFAPFNSLSPRVFQSEQTAKLKGPGPQDYSPRIGIEQELIKKIQRHFKGNFGSNEQRFKHQPSPITDLGPGSYDFPSVSPPSSSPNFYFLSRQQRF